MKKYLLFALTATLPLTSWAQVAPTVGDHYAGRASDTGFGGAVNSSGGYGASVPLDLPAAHGGLPVPLQIVYGGNRVGAAGLGWEVPLSFIRRDTTIAHHRPVLGANTTPVSRQRLILVLDGQSLDLIPKSNATTWVARRNGVQIEVRDLGGGAMVMYDGNGLTYTFNAQGGSAGARLENGNLSLLRDIVGPGGTDVHLEYGFAAPALGGGSAGVSIDLKNIRYNFDPTGACAKHQINLSYDAAVNAPLAVSMLGSTALARVDKLIAVDVTSKANSNDPGAPCSGAVTSLRKYTLAYQADPDTQLPRLQNVTLIGQQGTPERSVILPVATYGYGSATDNGLLKFEKSQSVPIPADALGSQIFTDPNGDQIANTIIGDSSTIVGQESDSSAGYRSQQGLIDVTGDGRPDFVFPKNNELWVAHNQPGAGIPTPTAANPITFGNEEKLMSATVIGSSTLPPLLSAQASTSDRYRISRIDEKFGSGFSRNFVWRQAIDVNGDGRLDFIDATEDAQHWIVYLNTPDPANPQHVVWQRRELGIGSLKAALAAQGFDFTDAAFRGHIPLASRTSGRDIASHECYHWNQAGNFWEENENGWRLAAPEGCTEIVEVGGNPEPSPQPNDDVGIERTFTDWELKDLNGDGYPDLVFNSSPTTHSVRLAKDTLPARPPTDNFWIIGHSHESIVLQGGGNNSVMALFNVLGVELLNDTPGASSSDHFSGATVVRTNAACGVSEWEELPLTTTPNGGPAIPLPSGIVVPSTHQQANCDIVDVNGDGIADRVEGDKVFLGTGDVGTTGSVADTTHFFTAGAILTLPAGTQIEAQRSDAWGFCRDTHSVILPHNRIFQSSHTTALRDLTGDGIPDLVVFDPADDSTTAKIYIGNGAGFRADAVPIQVNGSRFDISQEWEHCDGSSSINVAGLFDLDADGKADVVRLNGSNLDVFELKKNSTSFFGGLDAGRLVTIDTGYGALTKVGYRSAKEDSTTLHQVPYPEIVVTSVSTTDSSGAVLVAPTLYAYGDAELIFDSAYDAFVFPGYGRSITLIGTRDDLPNEGVATITDTFPLQPFDPSADANTRFRRYLKVGKVDDVNTLSGDVGRDPWALLTVNKFNDARRISGTHIDWDTKFFVGATTGYRFCTDMVYPYDFQSSSLYLLNHLKDSSDQCAQYGFAFQNGSFTWRGTPGTADAVQSPLTVQTSWSVDGVDDLGRITSVHNDNDLSRIDDDLCTQTVYAVPAGTNQRVLNSPASRTVTACTQKTLSRETWEYDLISPQVQADGSVVQKIASGFVTARTLEGHAVDDSALAGDGKPTIHAGDLLRTVRLLDATYDSTGNPLSVVSTREDGTTRTTRTTYDGFGLAPVSQTVDARSADGSHLPLQTTASTRDPVTLAATVITDPNGSQTGSSYDGFGRVLLSTVSEPNGISGILSSLSYQGFAKGDGSGRRITKKVFSDPVAQTTADGRQGTTYLDSLGRVQRIDAALGGDYANQVLTIGQRSYDRQGRVLFEADPHPSTESFLTAYGTTSYFNTDGTLHCAIRGNGLQPFTISTNEAAEIYPTCFVRGYENHTEIRAEQDADARLAGSAQADVQKWTRLTATGEIVARWTLPFSTQVRSEYATFGFDALGNLAQMSRYQNAAAGSNPVNTRWHYDSLGNVLELDDADSAPQFRVYDNWNELTESRWCDPVISTCSGAAAINRQVATRYDALGRVIHREEKTGGSIDPQSINDYAYDHAESFAVPSLTTTNVLGRLATATSPTSSISFSYDGLGQVEKKIFTDLTDASKKVYAEEHDFHADGTPNVSSFLLPDNGYQLENVRYLYDSAARLRSVTYQNDQSGEASQSLYNASSSGAIDVFGRIRIASYGADIYTANYADTGRRLLNDVKVTSPGGKSREVGFPASATGVPAIDPVGRERARLETFDGVARPMSLNTYDGLGRLATTSLAAAGSAAALQRAFSYDALGNLVRHDDASAASPSGAVQMSYGLPGGSDKDRLCAIGYAGATAPSTCNVQYDGVGNIASMPTRSSGLRTLSYFADGSVKAIVSGSSTATFDYDAFGQLQRLNVNSTTSPDIRHDKHFGALIAQRDEGGVSVVTRTIPAPGLSATRHGANGKWTLTFGEGRGNRFVTDETGQFVQDVSYQPYGEVIAAQSSGAQPGTTTFVSQQWNDGDSLAALGLSQLGARIYDPVIGRFVSRDPLLIPRTAATTNPYAFANNDPMNKSDPSGLDTVSCGDNLGAECSGGPGGPSFNVNPIVVDSSLLPSPLVTINLNGSVSAGNGDWQWSGRPPTAGETFITPRTDTRNWLEKYGEPVLQPPPDLFNRRIEGTTPLTGFYRGLTDDEVPPEVRRLQIAVQVVGIAVPAVKGVLWARTAWSAASLLAGAEAEAAGAVAETVGAGGLESGGTWEDFLPEARRRTALARSQYPGEWTAGSPTNAPNIGEDVFDSLSRAHRPLIDFHGYTYSLLDSSTGEIIINRPVGLSWGFVPDALAEFRDAPTAN